MTNFVYTLVDNRAVDRYEDFKLFKKREDAEAMRSSMNNESKHFGVHQVEVIE